MTKHFEWRGNILRLKCKLQTNASATKFAECINNELKIFVNAPPVDGKANVQLTKFLSQSFGVAKSAVTIVKGQLNQHKIVEIISPLRIPRESKIEPRP